MQFVTLNIIIDDLLKIIRGARPTQSEPITKIQVENWIHQYRSLLLKREIDKGKPVDPDFIQTIDAIKLTNEDLAGADSTVETGIKIYRTSIQIPSTVSFNNMDGLVFIGDLYQNEIQIVPEHRVKYQQYKKYTSNETLAYKKGDYIYIYNPKELRYITIRGVFEVPTNVYDMANTVTNRTLATYSDAYPIPMHLLPALKEMILKQELGIETKSPSDNEIDSKATYTTDIVN
jgi:hypothetical protein